MIILRRSFVCFVLPLMVFLEYIYFMIWKLLVVLKGDHEIKLGLLVFSVTICCFFLQVNGIFALPAVNVIWFIIANRTFEPEDERIRLFVSDNKTFFRAGTPTGSIADLYPALGYFSKNYQIRINHIHDTQRLIKVRINS